MKNDWEKVLIHDRAFIDAYCESVGKEKPIHSDGKVKLVMMRCFKKSFWDIFLKMGHDHAEFDMCKCQRR
jgi:hypothetical protein